MGDTKELPEIYDPAGLRPKKLDRAVTYAIVIQHRPCEFGMIYGPTSDFSEMLNLWGGEKQHIIRFDADWSADILYDWDVNKDVWCKSKFLIR